MAVPEHPRAHVACDVTLEEARALDRLAEKNERSRAAEMRLALRAWLLQQAGK